MAGSKADIMVTDPPYNVNYKDTVSFHKNGGYSSSRVVSDIANDNLSDKDFYEFLYGFFSTAYGILKGGASVYVFHSTKESINFITAMKTAGFKLSQTLTWVKNHFTLGRSDYQYITEPILYGWKVAEGRPHYFIDDRTLSNVFEDAKVDIKKLTKDEMRELLERIFDGLQTDAIRCDKPARSPDHPTMKPIMLCAKLIYNSSHEGDLVYEPFGGSGSTLIASAQLNRRCYASEIDARYCDVIAKRYAKEFPNDKIRLIRNGKEIDFGEI
jgi:DNA modification methylase